MLPIPGHAGRHIVNTDAKGGILSPGVGCRNGLPAGIVEIETVSPRRVADRDAPVGDEVVLDPWRCRRTLLCEAGRKAQNQKRKWRVLCLLSFLKLRTAKARMESEMHSILISIGNTVPFGNFTARLESPLPLQQFHSPACRKPGRGRK